MDRSYANDLKWQRTEDVTESEWWNTCSTVYAHIDIEGYLKSVEALYSEWENRWIGYVDWTDKVVVDYGCGGGHLGNLLLSKYKIKKYIAIDISRRSLVRAEKLLKKYSDRVEFLQVPVDFSRLGADVFVSQACMQHFQTEAYYTNFLTNLNQSGIPEVILQYRYFAKLRFAPSAKDKTKACKTNIDNIEAHLPQYTTAKLSEVYRKTNYQYVKLTNDPSRNPRVRNSKLPIGGRSVVIVGNGPSVGGSGKGPSVDACDEVVRCNMPTVTGFEGDVGSRTDCWAFNAAKSVKATLLQRVDQKKNMLLCTPFSEKKEAATIKAFKTKCAQQRVPFDWLKDEDRIEARIGSDMKNRQRLTTGLSAIVYYLKTFPDVHIYLHGFDYVISAKPSPLHYWNPQEKTRIKSAAHSPEKEAAYIKKLMKETGRISVLPPDPADVISSKQQQKPEAPAIVTSSKGVVAEVGASDCVVDREAIGQKPRRPGISGYLRARNEEDFLELCIESWIPYLDELVVVYNDCQDRTGEIVAEMARKYPDKIDAYHYLPVVYAQGTQKMRDAPDNSPHSLVNYYNFALSKTNCEYALKTDADTIAIPDMCQYWFDKVRTQRPDPKWQFGGINLWDCGNEIFVKLNRTVVLADRGFAKVRPGTMYVKRRNKKCEVLKSPGGAVDIKRSLYYHLKGMKKDRGVGVYDLDNNPNSPYHRLVRKEWLEPPYITYMEFVNDPRWKHHAMGLVPPEQLGIKPLLDRPGGVRHQGPVPGIEFKEGEIDE